MIIQTIGTACFLLALFGKFELGSEEKISTCPVLIPNFSTGMMTTVE
jgi:hypothetical protein